MLILCFTHMKRPLQFLLAVSRRFGRDGMGSTTAAIAAYGVVALLPLLYLFESAVLPLVLYHDPSLAATLLHSVLARFPVIGLQLQADRTSKRPCRGHRSQLKTCRGIATRHDKRAVACRGVVVLAAIALWLRA